MIKKLFAILAIISTIFAALFGFMAVSHAIGDMDHAGCIAALAENAFCGGLRDAFASLDFHMNFLRGLVTAVFATFAGAIFLVLVFKMVGDPRGALSAVLFDSRILRLSFSATGYGREALKYLSLRINSPSVV